MPVDREARQRAADINCIGRVLRCDTKLGVEFYQVTGQIGVMGTLRRLAVVDGEALLSDTLRRFLSLEDGRVVASIRPRTWAREDQA